jgi:hypothetical protein
MTNQPLLCYRQRHQSIQAVKSKNPRNYFNAMTAFHHGLVDRNQWDALSDEGHRKWYLFLARTSVGELLGQTTWSGYRNFYMGIRETNQRLGVASMIDGNTTALPPAVRRFISMVDGEPRERLRAFVESILAPLLGNAHRSHGVRRKLSVRAQHIIRRLFE